MGLLTGLAIDRFLFRKLEYFFCDFHMIGKLLASTGLRDVFRGSVIYVAVNILYKATPLVILPLVVLRLSVEDIGLLGLFTALVTLLIPIIACGTHGYISVQFAKRSESEISSLIGMLLFICFSSGVVIFFFGVLFSEFLLELTGLSWRHLALMLTSAMAHACIEIFLVLYQMRQRPLVYAAVRLTMMLFEAGCIIFLVLVFSWGLDGVLVALTVPPLIALSVLLLCRDTVLSHSITTRIDIQEALRFGLPVIGYQLGFLIVITADRLMVANILGLHDAGIFLIGVQIGMAIALLNGAINKAWVPWLFPKLIGLSSEGRAGIVRIEYWYFIFLFFAALCWSVIGSILLRLLFPVEYMPAEPVIWAISFGHALAGMYKAKSAYLFFAERTRPLFLLAALVALINIALNLLLIPYMGMLGAGIATLLSYLFAFFMVWFLGHRVYPMPVRVNLLSG